MKKDITTVINEIYDLTNTDNFCEAIEEKEDLATNAAYSVGLINYDSTNPVPIIEASILFDDTIENFINKEYNRLDSDVKEFCYAFLSELKKEEKETIKGLDSEANYIMGFYPQINPSTN